MKALVLMLLLLASQTYSTGQSKPVSRKRAAAAAAGAARKLVDITITGQTKYQPKQILAACGLEIGQKATEETFKDAVRKLGETGLFSDVAYSYSFDAEGTKLQIQLSDNEKLVPVEFDNLVWYSKEELIAKIQAAIPLFQGRVPSGGSMIDEIADVLSVLLAQKNPDLHLDYLRPSDPKQPVVFSVSGTQIQIHRVDFPGASSSHLAALMEAGKKLQGSDYLHGAIADFVKSNLQPIYLRDGYLKAAFGEPSTRVVSESPDETMVDVSLPVEEGTQYTLGKLTFADNSVFPAEKLQSQIHLQAGAPVNLIQLRNDLETIRSLYGTRGYVKAALHLQPDFNDTGNTVAYQVAVHEGDVYRMGDVDLEGLDDKAAARMREEWSLREGEPYDSTYSQRFVKQAAAELSKDAQWSIAVSESVNDKDKIVDVVLHFSKSQ